MLAGADGNAGYTWLCADGLAIGALVAVIARTPWAVRTNMVEIDGHFFRHELDFGGRRMACRHCDGEDDDGKCVAAGCHELLFRRTTVDCSATWNFAMEEDGEPAGAAMVWRDQLWPLPDSHDGVRRDGLFAESRCSIGTLLRAACGIYRASLRDRERALAIMVAYLSRWYFEEPFLRLKNRWES